jgi:cobalt-zinc-cadmium efflux system membrane fusion protein
MRIVPCMIFVVSFLIFGCAGKKEEQPEEVKESLEQIIKLNSDQIKLLQLSFGSAEKKQINSNIIVQGKIDLPPQNNISVNFSLGGFLKSTKLIPGMRITKGEVIAIMEDQAIIQLQQDYLLTVAKLLLAANEYDRQKTLFDANAGTSKLLQQASAEVKMQSINAKSLGEKLKLIGVDIQNLNEGNISGQVPIRSNINGYVSKVNVNTGKYVQPTETIFELIDPEDIHVALTLFEKDLPYVNAGNSVKVKFMQDPDVLYDADVILVNRNIDDDRTAIAHCHFKKTPKNLLPGMFVEGTISVKNKEAYILPEAAVQRFGNKEYIFISKGKDVVVMTEVQTGIVQDGTIEILSNIASLLEGRVVLNNTYKLLGMLKNGEK